MGLFKKRGAKRKAADKALDQSKAASERLLRAIQEKREERVGIVNELLGSLVPDREGNAE